ncbi:lipopolysaccharide heptosyltransferase I [Niveibacterium sp. SC-1]|uniref:lipopolysaccharide heptosyltransferase I n=1 Tax=Niveibacterium sp. SC-1 TaxID=3135646 RepID=UPI00311E887D
MPATLIVKTSSMGDVIQYLPAVTDLARHRPELAIDWLVEAPFAPLARLHPAVRRVIPVRLRTWRKTLLTRRTRDAIGELLKGLREADYARTLDAQGLFKSALLARAGRAPISGYGRGSAREAIATLFYDQRFDVSWDLHAVTRNRALTAAAFGYDLDGDPDYGVRAPAAAPDSWQISAPYAVLFTATARDEKLWPESHWIALGRALSARGLRCALPAGNDAERTRANRIATAVPGADIVPAMGLAELSRVIADARLAVGVDTGLSHLAAALRVPVVALYVATEPGANGVAGDATAINLGGTGQCPTPDEVLAALTPWLPA